MRLFDETEDAVNGRPGAADFVAAWARRGPKDVDALASRPLDFIVWSDEGVLWECRMEADEAAASRAQGLVQAWVDDAINSHAGEATTRGFVDVHRSKKGWKRRWMVYHERSHQLTLYACESGDDERSVAMRAQRRGSFFRSPTWVDESKPPGHHDT